MTEADNVKNAHEVMIGQEGTITTITYRSSSMQIVCGLLLIILYTWAIFRSIEVYRWSAILECLQMSLIFVLPFSLMLLVQHVVTAFDADTHTIRRSRSWSFARLIPLWTWKYSYNFFDVSIVKVTHQSRTNYEMEYRLWLELHNGRTVFVAAEGIHVSQSQEINPIYSCAARINHVLGKSHNPRKLQVEL